MNTHKEDAKLLLHQALNLIDKIELINCFVPRAKAIVITKIEEALLWMDYEGRTSNKPE
jgi:hypothetical protein